MYDPQSSGFLSDTVWSAACTVNVFHHTGAAPPSASSTLQLLNEDHSERGISARRDFSCFDFLHILLI